MNGLSRQQLFVFLAIAIVFTSRGECGDTLRALLQCKHAPIDDERKVGIFFFKSDQFRNVQRVEIPTSGASLFDTMIKNDSTPFAIAKLRNRRLIRADKSEDPNEQVKDENGSDQEKEQRDLRRKSFFVGATRSNEIPILLHLRGNDLTVLPRWILIHPAITTSLIKPNDVIATTTLLSTSFDNKGDDKAASPEVVARNQADPIHRWFYEKIAAPADREPISILVGGDKIRSEARGRRTFGNVLAQPTIPGVSLPPPTTGVAGEKKENTLLVHAIDKETRSSENDLNLGQFVTSPDSPATLILCVVTRSVSPYTFRYIVPVEAGSFGEKGTHYEKLFPDAREGDTWKFDEYLQLPLLDGDRLDFVAIPQVPLFRERTAFFNNN